MHDREEARWLQTVYRKSPSNSIRKRKPVVATFDAEHASTDGGAILLKGIDTQFGLTKRVAACLEDERQPGKVQHQTLELIRQRVFGIACGYADCNDAARLADDAIHKLLLERDPLLARLWPRSPRCRGSRMPWGRGS